MDLLFDYQREHLSTLLDIIKRTRIALDVSNTGTGKTYVATIMAKILNIPYIVLCPKCMISSWKHVGIRLSYPAKDIVNYDTARMGKMYQGDKRIRSSYVIKNARGFDWDLPEETLVIFDEADVCTHLGTLNNKLLLSFKSHLRHNYLLLLSATLCSNSKNIPSILTMIGKLESPKAYSNFMKYQQRNNQDEQSITNKILFPKFGNGMFISKLGDRFMENNVHLDMYNVDDIEEVQKEFQEIEDGLSDLRLMKSKENQLYFFLMESIREIIKKLEDKKSWKKLAEKVLDETDCKNQLTSTFWKIVKTIRKYCDNYLENGRGNIYDSIDEVKELLSLLKSKRNRYIHPKENEIIVRINRARQRIELRRIPIFIELTKSAIEEGKSVVIFVNYTRTREILQDHLKTECVIAGNTPNIDININKFQSDAERIIICQSAAGSRGISLHDITGKYPRLALISPVEGDILIQILGRVNRAGSKTVPIQKIVYLAETIEENVCAHMRKNLSNMDRTLGSLGHIKIDGIIKYSLDEKIPPLIYDE